MNNKIINIISVIITIIILVISGYFIYKTFFISNTSSSTPSTLTKEEINKIGEERFNFINSKQNIFTSKLIFFTNNNLNINNISNQDILYIAYSLVSPEDKNGSGQTNSYCFNENIDLYQDDCYRENFDKNVLQEQINKNFSDQLKVNYVDFNTSGNLYCKINNNTYNCRLKRHNIEPTNILTVSIYDSSNMNNNTLEVYSYLLTVVRSSLTQTPGIYSDSNATNLIDNLTYFNEEVGTNMTKANYKKLITKYKDKITKYKSIFKYVNNNYVWESTEKISNE